MYKFFLLTFSFLLYIYIYVYIYLLTTRSKQLLSCLSTYCAYSDDVVDVRLQFGRVVLESLKLPVDMFQPIRGTQSNQFPLNLGKTYQPTQDGKWLLSCINYFRLLFSFYKD